MGKRIDLVGQRFGRLTVIEEQEQGRDKNGGVLWKCHCDCGNTCVVSSNHLRSGHIISCGCFRRECVTKHGLSKHPLYRVWADMMQRTGVWKCTNDMTRRNYIDRRISLCDEWQNFENFAEWALSHGYEKGLDLDRRDNSRGYSPENCRFVSRRENMNNRRCTRTLCGCSLAMLCSDLGIETCEDGKKSDIYSRISLYHTRHKGTKVHRDLVLAMSRDIEKQERLLDEIISKRKQVEAELARLKALLK